MGWRNWQANAISNYYRHAYGIPYVALRYANIYGPRQDPYGEAGVVAIFTGQLLRGDVPVINGTGRQTRDYVFVADVVQADLLAPQTDYCGALNIGTGVETDVNQLSTILRRRTNSNTSARHAPPSGANQTAARWIQVGHTRSWAGRRWCASRTD